MQNFSLNVFWAIFQFGETLSYETIRYTYLRTGDLDIVTVSDCVPKAVTCFVRDLSMSLSRYLFMRDSLSICYFYPPIRNVFTFHFFLHLELRDDGSSLQENR